MTHPRDDTDDLPGTSALGVRARSLVFGASILIHLCIGMGMAAIEVKKAPEAVVVEMTTLPEPEKKEEKPPEPEPPPVEAPKPAPKRAAPVEAAPPVAAEPAPDFGFALSSGGGPGGVAVAAPKAAPEPPRQATRKVLSAAAAAPEASTCAEPDTKAKATSMPHPAYTEEARAAAVEGKVRVELSLDASGKVIDARVVEGLGHGLDDAALAALRAASFAPATHCGTPVASTFVVSVRFAL